MANVPRAWQELLSAWDPAYSDVCGEFLLTSDGRTRRLRQQQVEVLGIWQGDVNTGDKDISVTRRYKSILILSAWEDLERRLSTRDYLTAAKE